MRTLVSFLFRLLTVLLIAGTVVGCSSKKNQSGFLEAAKKLFDSGEYEKAKAEYMKVLRQDPGNTTALTQLGLIWMEQGAPRRAAPFLVAVTDKTPSDIPVRTKLMKATMLLQDFARTRQEAGAILQLDPANEEALYMLAACANTPDQMEAVRQVIAKFPARNSAAYFAAPAALLLKTNDLGSAEKAVRQALQVNPKSLPAHVALARICAAKKDAFEAEDEFKTVSELAPLRSLERLYLAEFKFGQGQVGEAGKLVDAVTQKAGDYLPAWTLAARLAATAKNYSGAETILQKVADIDPENYDARILQSQVLTQDGKVATAIEVLENLLKSHAGHPGIQYLLARNYVLNGDSTKALPLLTQSVATNPDSVEAVLLLAGLSLQRGQANDVISQMRILLTKRPGLVAATSLLAVAYQSAGRSAEGIVLMKDLVKEAPSNTQFRQQLGVMYRQAGQLNEARQMFEEVARLAPSDLAPVGQLVDLDIEGKHFDEAVQRVQQVLEKSPKSAQAWLLKGRIYFVQKKWDEAEAALKQAIGADPGYLPASQLLTRVFVESKQLPRALEQTRQVLDKQPDNRQSLRMAAMIFEAKGEFGEAAGYFEKLHALDPGNPELMNSLACLYGDHLNDLEKAYNLALEARRLRPPADPSQPLASRGVSSAIADTLGWIRYKRREYREAFQLILEASRDIGDDPEVQYHLGMAAAMMGQTEVARKALIAALKPAGGLPAEFPARTGIQARLTLLGGADATAGVVPLAELETAATKQPNDPLVQFLLANALENEKDFERAAAAYEKTVEQNPGLVAAIVNLARLNSGPLHNPKKALELAKKARDFLADDPAASGPLGVIAFDAGDYAWAYDLLGQSTRVKKPDPPTLRSFAWASYSQGKVTDAQAIMQRLIDESPGSAEAGDAKSFLSMTTRAPDGKVSPELVSAAGNVLKTNPDNVPALMVQAKDQAQAADPGPAESTLNTVLKKYPDFTPAMIELADLYARQPGTRDKAWELATAARKVQPEDPGLIKVLAALSYFKKDYEYAIQLLQPAAAKNSLNAESLFYLGMSQWQKNDKEAGRSALSKALEMGLPPSTKEEAARVLREGGKN